MCKNLITQYKIDFTMSKTLSFLLILFIGARCWDLSQFNLSENYFVSSIASYGIRAFLALPRSSCYNNFSHPTLVEVSWHNQNLNLRKQPYFFNEQQWSSCDHIQDAMSLDIEPLKGRLWILDKGSPDCPAKISVYYLFQKLSYQYELANEIKSDLSCLVVDTGAETTLVYIGLREMNRLLVFSLAEMKLWTVILLAENSVVQVSTEFLALSRKDSVLYVTGGEERELFSVNLKELRKRLEETEELNVNFLGEKLGPSTSLVADLKDGLSYYLTKDYAVVRWNTRNPSQAEFYNVLAQSYEILPFVSQLYTDPHNGIWALTNPGSPEDCLDPNFNISSLPELERRLVKIMKYNFYDFV